MNSNDKKVTFFGFGILFLMIAVAFVFGSNAQGDGVVPPEDPDEFFKDLPLYSETLKFSKELEEGATQEIPLDLSGMLVKNITATLTWSDETQQPAPRPRRHENQPDSFSLGLEREDGNGSNSGTGSNPVGGDGEIVVQITIPNNELKIMIDEGIMNWSAVITMTDAGIWVPQTGLGLIGLTDPGNLYSMDILIEYYDLNEIMGV